MVLAFSVAPSGTGCEDGPVHDAVAAAANVVRDSGSPNTTSSLFAETEGAQDEGVGMVKRATEAVEPFSSRISLVSKVDVRTGCGASRWRRSNGSNTRSKSGEGKCRGWTSRRL